MLQSRTNVSGAGPLGLQEVDTPNIPKFQDNRHLKVTRLSALGTGYLYPPRQALVISVNPLKPNDHYSGRTAPLTSKRCILYIYSTNIGTEYFKRDIYPPFFPLQNAACFIILTYLVPVLFTFYIQVC